MESHNEKTFFALDKQRTPESGGRVWAGSQVFRQRATGAVGVGQAAALVGGRADEHMGQE